LGSKEVSTLKQQINPVVAVVAVILVFAVAGFLVWRGAQGGVANVGPGQPGNPGPFAPGGAATNKGGNAMPQGVGKSQNPNQPPR
jgi:hypothetical protein